MLSPLPLCFVSVADSGSITRAAEELNLAKSAVSQNLKRLEEQLGVKLATRTTRRLSLTPAGERYYQRCKALLAMSQQAATEMELFGAAPSGPIVLTAPHALIGPLIAPAMAQIKQKFPDLSPQVIADDARLDLIAEGIDLSIAVGALPDSSLRARRIGALRDILCAAPDVMAEAPAPEHPDFATWASTAPYVAHTREAAEVTHILPAINGAPPLSLRFSPSFRANTIDSIASFARAGLGVALLPDLSAADDLRSGRLVPVCGTRLPEPTPIYAVHAYDRLVPKSVEASITAIQGALLKMDRVLSNIQF